MRTTTRRSTSAGALRCSKLSPNLPPGVERSHAHDIPPLTLVLRVGGRSPASPRCTIGGGSVAEDGVPGPTRHGCNARARCAPLQRPPPANLELAPCLCAAAARARRVGGLPVRLHSHGRRSAVTACSTRARSGAERQRSKFHLTAPSFPSFLAGHPYSVSPRSRFPLFSRQCVAPLLTGATRSS